MLKPLDVHWYSVAYNSVAPLLQLDRFTMGYLVVAVLVMLLSHPLAWRDGGGRWTWRLGCLLAAPTMVLFAVAVVALAWALVLGAIALAAGLLGLLINGEFEFVTLEANTWLGMLAVLVTSVAYFCACQAAVFAPGYIRDAWRKPAPDRETRHDPELIWLFSDSGPSSP
jgi:hypothetical protein